MTGRLRDLPIATKVRWLLMAASGGGLLMAAVAIAAFEALSFQQRARHELASLGDMIAVSVQAAVQFDDDRTARETLAVLRGQPEIQFARLEKHDGTVLAIYAREGSAGPTPGALSLRRHLVYEGVDTGVLTLQATTGRLGRRLAAELGILAAVTAVLLGIVYLISGALQRAIVQPILRLAGVAEAVSRSPDDAARAEVVSHDEIGQLAQSFNSMLATLQTRNEEQRRAEARLRESEEQFRGAFADAPIGMALLAPDSSFLQVNAELCTMLGYSTAELLERRLDQLVVPGTWRNDLPTPEAPRARRQELVCQHRRGHEVWVLLSATLLVDDDGRPLRYVLQLEDVSDWRHADKERSMLEERLRQAQKMEAVGQLAGGVAHDFNNLLTPIIGNAELMLMERPDGPESESALQIRDAAGRAAQLTRQLLAFARKQVFEMVRLDLNKEVQGLSEILRRLLRENIELRFDLDPDLAPVRADRSQIQQILMNLAVNAQDAMPEGGRLTIATSNVLFDAEAAKSHPGAVAGPHARLSVRDTGIGMEEETCRHIFEPFFTTKAPGKGTGLGLATVDGIVRQHGGVIAVESAPGEGSVFHVFLPRADSGVTAVTPTAPAAIAGGGPESILVVEDDARVRRMVCDILRRGGYDVREAQSPESALDKILAAPVDLLLTDVIMPGMSGRQLAEAALRVRPEMAVLFMSGYPDAELTAQGVLLAGAQLLNKPFSVRELTEKVRAVLNLRARRAGKEAS